MASVYPHSLVPTANDEDDRPTQRPGRLRATGSGVTDVAGELETARRRIAQLERSTAVFGAIFHEVRTLLSSVTGLSTIVLDGDLSAAQRDNVKRIRGAGGAIVELVNGALDLGKLEANGVAEDADFDLRRKLEDVACFAAEAAAAKGIELVTTIDPGVATALRGDSGRLRHVLLNLVTNAIKFTDEGEVMIRATTSCRHSTDGRSFIAVDVVDTGRGISPEFLPHVFEPFRQGPSASQGAGLGLAIVRDFVESMGGDVACESRLGEGTTFRVEVPFRIRERAVERRADLGDRRVLIFETSPFLRRELAREIARTGAGVIEAPNAEEAARRLAQATRPFDAVLIGCGATGGASVVSSLLGRLRGAVPVLLECRGHALPESAITGAIRVEKPLRMGQLLATLERNVNRREETVAVSANARIRPVVQQPQPVKRAALRALLVEDDAVNAQVASFYLKKRGVEVDLAVDGSQAIRMVDAGRYDVVFMDWHTPNVDGLQATGIIRASEHGARTPIVGLTAHGGSDARTACLSAGMDDFLTKPIESSELDRVLAAVAAGRYGASEASNAEPAMDWTLLRGVIGQEPIETSTLGGQLAEIFLRIAPLRIAEIRRGIATKNQEAVRFAAHALTGASRQIGANRIGKLAATLERGGASDAVVAKLDDELGHVRRELERTFPRVFAG